MSEEICAKLLTVPRCSLLLKRKILLMLNILRSIAGITKASLVHMRREVFISKTLCRHVKKAAFCI